MIIWGPFDDDNNIAMISIQSIDHVVSMERSEALLSWYEGSEAPYHQLMWCKAALQPQETTPDSSQPPGHEIHGSLNVILGKKIPGSKDGCNKVVLSLYFRLLPIAYLLQLLPYMFYRVQIKDIAGQGSRCHPMSGGILLWLKHYDSLHCPA